MHASHCVLTCGGIAIISQNFPQTLLHGTQDAVLKSVNWLCIFMSCWLVCDLLTFATVSCIAFDVSVIINEAPLFPLHQALPLLLLYISCHESFFVHFFSDQIVTCLDGSDLGKFGLVLGALIKPGQWRRYKMCRGRGYLMAQQGVHLPPGLSVQMRSLNYQYLVLIVQTQGLACISSHTKATWVV